MKVQEVPEAHDPRAVTDPARCPCSIESTIETPELGSKRDSYSRSGLARLQTWEPPPLQEGPKGSAAVDPNGQLHSGLKTASENRVGDAAVLIRDRIRDLRRVRAADLVPNPKNWRRHPKAQANALRGLLREIGFADALLVRELSDGRFMIIDGHLRAAATLDQAVPVLVLDVTEEEADKILLTLDPLAAMAESDSSRVQTLLEAVRSDDQAVNDLLRLTAGERVWQIVHPEELRDAEVPLEKADELRKKWCTERGQLWQSLSHRLICGDCTDQMTMKRLWTVDSPSLRMVWTDPPYGVRYGCKTTGNRRGRRPIENDSLPPDELQRLFGMALSMAREHAIAGAVIYATVPSAFLKYFIQGLEDGGFVYHHCLIWVKQAFVLGRVDYHYQHEPVLYGWLEDAPHYFTGDRTQSSVFAIDRPMASPDHPTCKPVELIARMINNSSLRGELVYDPFCGSGSTIVAAHQLGRIGYGCEIDPGYLAVALERLALLGLQPELVRQ